MLPAVVLARAAHDWLAQASCRPGPGRFVAVLAGPCGAPPDLITTCRELAWHAHADDTFAVAPVEFTRIEYDLRGAGLAFRGFAHGHGDGSAAPSRTDQRALWRGCVQFIGARSDRGAVLRAYWLPTTGEGYRPLPWWIAAEAP